MPERIQLRRTAGWRKPADAVVVARPTVWGNPFRVDRHRGDGLIWLTYSLGPDDVEELRTVETVSAGRALAVECYERALYAAELLFVPAYARERLAGRDLACWCPFGEPCHADVLIRIANGDRAVSPLDECPLTELPAEQCAGRNHRGGVAPGEEPIETVGQAFSADYSGVCARGCERGIRQGDEIVRAADRELGYVHVLGGCR